MIVVPDSAKCRRIVCSRVILVPYQPVHVPKYHEWMSDPYLLRVTGSEPLTLDEEFEMQQTWVKDSNKCTFIVLDKALFEETKDEVSSMIGDTNLYLTNTEDEDCGEIEVMIGEKSFWGNGYGREIVLAMMKFCHEELNVLKFMARIKMDNVASIRLFQTHLKFEETSRSDVFQEVTLILDVSKHDNYFGTVSISYETI